jgi:hypothetical protein
MNAKMGTKVLMYRATAISVIAILLFADMNTQLRLTVP